MNRLNQATLQQAATLLKQGGLVAFPTETVYALGADATNPRAVERIFQVKARALDQPLGVLLAESQQILNWAPHASTDAWKLAHRFWPGPLTLILECAHTTGFALTAGQATIGLRWPNHPVAQALLETFGGAIAASSANCSGDISPTCAEHVQQTLGGRVDLILEAGTCDIGIESTVADLTGLTPRILRQGAIPVEQIQGLLAKPVIVANTRPRHAEARFTLQLVAVTALETVVSIHLDHGEQTAVLARRTPFIEHPNLLWLIMPDTYQDYQHTLYAQLHRISRNRPPCERVIVETVPNSEEWSGVLARLQQLSR